MTATPSRLVILGDLHISSPTDDFTLHGDEEQLTLTGPSLRAFIRLRRHAARAGLPPWAADVAARIGTRASLILICRCRGRDIATMTSGPNGMDIRSSARQMMLAALRL